MFIVNPQASWKEKKGTIAVYLGFDFFFFQAKPRYWLKQLLSKERTNRSVIPEDFLDYLYERKILIKHG